MSSERPSDSAGPRLRVDPDGIAHVVFDDPNRSVNVLGAAEMARLADLVAGFESGAADDTLTGVVFRSARSDSFIVGADLDAIAAIEDPDEGAEAAREGQMLFRAIEKLPVPTLCAIRGPCMGGGTELALACRYRVISDHPKSRMALPEVQLGILPAWGGTTRLPRLIGLQAALDLLLTGRSVDPDRARKLGLVEEVLPDASFDDEALRYLRARVETGHRATGARRGLLRRLVEDTAPGRAVLLRAARKRVLARTGGHYPAPLRILDVLGEGLGRSVEDALELEAEAAGELLVSSVAKNLIHVFRLRERARKRAGALRDATPREIVAMGVVGAGVMGGGIAHLAAEKGVRVRMKDIHHEAVASGLRHARSLLDRSVEKRRLRRREAERVMERISGGLDFAGFGTLDLVVEAVVERLDVKRSVLAEVETGVREACMLTTNTSTLSVDRMAEALSRPERFCGMHFFNPVHRMPLVEIVAGEATDASTLATVHAFAVRLGKVPVVVRDGPGFLVNRILGPYLNEAGHLLAEGASVDQVDAAAKAFGMPMGPLRLVDEVGIDVARHAGEVLHEAFGDRMAPSAPLVAIGETGRLGAKGGRGFYRHGDGGERVDPDVYQALGASVPPERKNLPEEAVRARLVLAMINEAARVLEDGIARSAADIDVGMIMGTGFPPFRGGLLRFADTLHPREIVERLKELESEHGARFHPAPLILRLAAEDRSFYRAFPGDDG